MYSDGSIILRRVSIKNKSRVIIKNSEPINTKAINKCKNINVASARNKKWLSPKMTLHNTEDCFDDDKTKNSLEVGLGQWDMVVKHSRKSKIKILNTLKYFNNQDKMMISITKKTISTKKFHKIEKRWRPIIQKLPKKHDRYPSGDIRSAVLDSSDRNRIQNKIDRIFSSERDDRKTKDHKMWQDLDRLNQVVNLNIEINTVNTIYRGDLKFFSRNNLSSELVSNTTPGAMVNLIKVKKAHSNHSTVLICLQDNCFLLLIYHGATQIGSAA